ncbi:MAG: hypothetical protein GY820_39835 [Gammaproteobacteria bacterium]|nr:hypothetical protein [Gammaproteobacteria bacterium]
MPKLTQSDKKQIAQDVKHSKLVEASRKLARIVKHVDPPPAILKKRAQLEKSLSAWVKFFLPEAFCDKWSPDHKRVIGKLSKAIKSGGLFAVAMPRGHGKSTICKGTILYAVLTGRRRYVVSIAATAELAQAMVEFVRQQITENDSLHEYYPHVTTYARATDGKAIKARYQLRADGKTSGIEWSKNALVFPEVVAPDGSSYPSDGAILEAHGLTGAIRGKWRDTKTGKVLRPDFALLDDPQTRESAESPTQCAMRERIITGDVLGLAGPRVRISAVMPCTIVRKGDLADRFLDHALHPEFQGETSALVVKWPDAQDTLWAEYGKIYREEVAAGCSFAKATEYYKSHRAAMNKGHKVSWKERVRDGEISAIQTAENLLIETGPQFWAEYQNQPQDAIESLYELTPQMICDHATKLLRLHAPPASTVLVCHIDINRAGLHWMVAAYEQNMTGHCPAYGKYPTRGDLWKKNAMEMERQGAIFTGLKELCALLGATIFLKDGAAMPLNLVLIDRGYEPQTVHRFVSQAAYPFRVFPARGYAAHKYWVRAASLIGKPFEGCHQVKSDFGPFLSFNADMWRETSQRAFLGPADVPGGFTLHAGQNPKYHMPLAEHLVAERLVNKYITDAGMRWEWTHHPGTHWDWGDACTGCWVAAAACGLSASGTPTPRKARQKRRVRHVAV